MTENQETDEGTETQEFMDLEEVAEHLKVSMTTIYRYIHSKKNPLPSFKITRKKILVKKVELDDWIVEYRKGKK